MEVKARMKLLGTILEWEKAQQVTGNMWSMCSTTGNP
jgi:hypothetical protein